MFWKFVRSIRTSKTRASCIFHGGTFLHSDNDIANCFADHFEAVYVSGSDRSLCSNHVDKLDITSINISIVDVFNCIDTLSLNCGTGINDIPYR